MTEPLNPWDPMLSPSQQFQNRVNCKTQSLLLLGDPSPHPSHV